MERVLPVLFLLAALLNPGALRADTVTLRNGNVIDGRILRETEAGVEVEVAHGTVFLPRSSIASIRRTRSRQELLAKARRARERGETERALALLREAASDPALERRANIERLEILTARFHRRIEAGRIEWAEQDLETLRGLGAGSPLLPDGKKALARLRERVDAGLEAASEGHEKAATALTAACNAYPSRRRELFPRAAEALVSLSEQVARTDPAAASKIHDRALSYHPVVYWPLRKAWASARRARAR
ncbi:MAG: hypothetical protein ACYS47_11190, partial [Planctomycetota bacterium]